MEYNKDELISRLETYLSNLNINPKDLFDFMKKYNMCLSGSFLLETIQNTNYDYYDIDMFILGNQNFELETEIMLLLKNTNVYGKFHNINAKLENHYNKQNSNAQPINYELNGILSVSTCVFNVEQKNRCKGIQIIYIDDTKYKNISNFIDMFDIDACMNYFDGENIFINYPEEIKNNIATFIINNDKTFIVKRQEYRINKYKNRGFNIKLNFTKFNKIYDTLIYDGNIKQQIINSECKNLCIIMKSEGEHIIPNDLSVTLENLLIYNFDIYDIIDNLPINLNLLKIYDVQYGLKKKDADKYNKLRKIYSDIKIPFDCKFYVNEILFNN